MHSSFNKRSVSWMLYDLANTSFSVLVISIYAGLWISQDLAGGTERHYLFATSLSMLLVALLSPAIGVYADRRIARRHRLLTGFTLFSSLAVASFALLGEGDLWLALLLFVLSNTAYQLAIPQYDSLLPSVSSADRVGRIGGWGVAVGWLGTFISALLARPVADAYGRQGVFVLTALLFTGFALPAMAWVRARPLAGVTSNATKKAYAQVFETLRRLKEVPGLGRYLIANFIFLDAINTVISIMAIYASTVGSLSDNEILYLFMGSSLFAILGSFVFGILSDTKGPKFSLVLGLILWVGTATFVALSAERWMFFIIGPLVGACLGAVNVTTRTLLIALVPAPRIGEFVGFYSLAGKFAAVFGPLLFGAITWIAIDGLGYSSPAAYRIGVGGLVVLLAAGLVVLLGVPAARPHYRDRLSTTATLHK